MHRHVVLALILLGFVASSVALYEAGLSKTLAISDYISDEVWYVSSAINVARQVLGWSILPKVNSTHAAYTVFYSQACSEDMVLREVEVVVGGPVALARTGYRELRAVAVYVPAERAEALAGYRGPCIKDVMPGIAPDHENINSYLNTEHPPLVKYIIAALIKAYGFRYAAWRYASFAFGLLSLAAAYALVYAVSRRYGYYAPLAALLSAVPVAFALRDAAFKSMSSVGMLDIYSSSLSALGTALAALGRLEASAVLFGLAFSSKYSALFPLAPLVVYVAALRGGREAARFLLLFFLFAALPWIPFVLARGPGFVVREVVGAFTWHTSTKPGDLPTVSPLDMLLARNSFVLYYRDNEPYLVAACNPGVCVTGLVLAAAAVAAAVAAALCSRWRLVAGEVWVAPALAYVGVNLGYAALYAAGNRSLYSFYTVQHSVHALLVLVTTPLLLGELTGLRGRLEPCRPTLSSLKLAAVAGSLAGVVASAYMSEWPPPLRLPPALAPLAYVLASRADKLVHAALVAVSVLVYAGSALKYPLLSASSARPSWRDVASAALLWAGLGLTAHVGFLSSYAPLFLVIALEGGGAIDGLLAGFTAPAPVAVALGWRGSFREYTRFAAGFLLGYAASLLVASRYASISGSGLALALVMLAAGLALPLAYRGPEARRVAASLSVVAAADLLALASAAAAGAAPAAALLAGVLAVARPGMHLELGAALAILSLLELRTGRANRGLGGAR
ncbi:MAG: hypothetical protein ABWW70_01440 [Thermoproteota archaeon]